MLSIFLQIFQVSQNQYGQSFEDRHPGLRRYEDIFGACRLDADRAWIYLQDRRATVISWMDVHGESCGARNVRRGFRGDDRRHRRRDAYRASAAGAGDDRRARGASPEAPDDAAVSAEGPDLSSPKSGTSKAELEAASPEAASVDRLAPAPDEPVAGSPSAEAPGERDLPFDVEHLGPLRRAVLDHLVDTDEPQSVAQVLAAMPVGTTRGSGESAIKREFDAGRILRTSPGHYALAPARPPEAKRPSTPPPPTPDEEAIWFDALERWAVDPASWNVEELGPPPDAPDNKIPPDVRLRFADRIRKRQERRREADAAAAKRAVAERELRDRLIAATGGNVIRGPGIEDVSPIQLALQVVPIGRIVSSIRSKTDKKLYPRNEPATSWRERRLLKAIAEDYCSSVIVPSLVAAWEAAGKTPGKPVERVAPSPAISAPATEETAPAAPPTQSNGAEFLNAEISGIIKTARHPGSAEDVSPDTIAEPVSDLPDGKVPEVAAAFDSPILGNQPAVPAAQPDDGKPVVAEGRQQVLAAFARNRTPPSPRPAAPQPRPPERPWFAGPEAPQPESEMTDDGWRFVLEGYVVRSVVWAKKHGPPPGTEGCRVPRGILKEFGF